MTATLYQLHSLCMRVSVRLSMSHSPLPGLGAEHWDGYEGISCASVHHTI